MANLYGTNATKALDPYADNILPPGTFGGKVRVNLDTYAMVGMDTGAFGDILYLGGKLPAGAKILQIVLAVTAAQTSLTFKLGTLYNDDEFLTGSSLLDTADVPQHINGKQYVVGTAVNDDQIIFTNAGAVGTAATLYVAILYVIE